MGLFAEEARDFAVNRTEHTSCKCVKIKNAISEYNMELKQFKEQLTLWRHTEPWQDSLDIVKNLTKADQNSIRCMTTYIKEINDNVTPLSYVLGENNKLKKEEIQV